MASQAVAPDGPVEYCDLVMKGGITSGVVYPLAIAELSRKYFFKNIGGSSAGAVAAVIAAAAEFARRNGDPLAYDLLAGLPRKLGTNNLLIRLFQPSTAAARIFRVALAALKSQSILLRTIRAIGALVYQFWGSTVVGALLGGFVPLLLFLVYGGPVSVYVVLGLFWILVTSAVVVMIAAGTDAIKATTENGFGFCSGFDPDSKTGTPLTNWLHEQIQTAARKDPAIPLTFGDLWKAPAMPGEPPGPAIKLQVVTTNLTVGRPFTLPFESYSFYFNESEFRKLFPLTVVQYMIDHSPKKKRNETITSRDGIPLHRLPEGADLPIVVAARMSLSFPFLLSAVPLYLADYAHRAFSEEPELTETVEAETAISVGADRCWFSDGGICSNFPMHFFDSPLPRWPTFGIDLEPDRCEKPKSNEDMVWFPPLPGSGSQLPLANFDQGSSWERLVGFVIAIVNTMQNWRDTIQATAAGYRDRIVHVKVCPAEGGLNLNMPSKTITDLSDRGRIAGQVIVKHFDFASHVFARYRITMCALQRYLNSLTDAWTQPVPQDEAGYEYVRGNQKPPHYNPRSERLRHTMLQALIRLTELSRSWQDEVLREQNFCKDNAPRPEPILRNQPKF